MHENQSMHEIFHQVTGTRQPKANVGCRLQLEDYRDLGGGLIDLV